MTLKLSFPVCFVRAILRIAGFSSVLVLSLWGVGACNSKGGGENIGCGDVGSGATPDTTAPTVLATSPPDGATIVPLNAALTATFSEAMDCRTVTNATFLVSANGIPIEGTISYTNGTAIFAPNALLAGGSTYRVRLTTTMADAAGNPLATEYSWMFTPPLPQFAYVTNTEDNTISTYWADVTTGQLYHRGDVAVTLGKLPISVTVGPSKQFIYVANFGADTVSGNVTAFRMDQTTGTLTELGTTGAVVNSPQSIRVDPSGQYAYVANFNSGNVVPFRINVDGNLVPIQIGGNLAVADAGDGPVSIAVEPSGQYVYVANLNTQDVTTFSIAPSTGVLTRVGTRDVAAGVGPRSVAVDPLGQYVYVANRIANSTTNVTSVSMYNINQSTGALISIGQVTVGTALAKSGPESVTVDPMGRFAYVADPGYDPLSPSQPVCAGLSPNVTVFPIDSNTGGLGAGTPFPIGTCPVTVTVDPTGQYAYVVDFKSNNVATFSVDHNTGALTAVGSNVATGAAPYAMAIVGF